MNQDRYFTNSSSSKPLTATEGVETRKYSGNPLLREVDEQLKRLRSQFDKVATGTTPSANPISSSPTSGSYNSFSNYYSSGISPQGSKIQRVEESSRSSYATDSFQQQPSYTSQRQNYHRDSARYGATENVASTPQGLSSYGGYQGSSNISSNSGNFPSYNQNTSNSNIQRPNVVTKTPTNNGSLEFKSSKNLTNSGRYDPQPQTQPQQPQVTQISQSSYQTTNQGYGQTYNQNYNQSYNNQSNYNQGDNNQSTNQVSYNNNLNEVSNQGSVISQGPVVNQVYSQQSSQISSQGFSASTSPLVPILEVTNSQPFKLPAIKPEIVKVSSPQSETIRINSPPKIRSGPSSSEIARAQEQAKRKAQMQIIEKERELAKQFQEQTTRLREQRERATNQRRQKQEREASISKTQLGNYVNNINDKNRKISELQNKINQMTYQIANAENEAKRYKIQIESLKNNHKSQLESTNTTITNLKREIDLLNRDKDRRNVDLENKINKINFSYQEVNATNNRLNREIEGLKRQVEKKSTTTEVNQTVFEDFKIKINEKTLRINELEKELDQIVGQRNQLKKRVDELLLQGYEPKREFNLEKLEKQPGAFDEILKMNLEENQTYKSNLSVKEEQIFRLEQINRTLKGENERMKNEIEIEKLKRMTELKNTQTTMDIEVQVKQNEINSLNHVIVSLEEKLKFIVQEDRKKDQFMVTYLKGRAESAEEKQSVDEFFKQFELLSVNTNIAECLKREQVEILKLKDEIQKMYRDRR